MSIKSLKASDYYKIVAAVLEIAEEVGINVKPEVSLEEDEKQDFWKMSFTMKKMTVKELNMLGENLGADFDVIISPKEKTLFQLFVKAPAQRYLKFINKDTLTAN